MAKSWKAKYKDLQANKYGKNRTISINAASLLSMAVAGAALVTNKHDGGRNAIELAVQEEGFNKLNAIGAVGQAVMDQPLVVIGIPLAATALNKTLGRWSPRVGIKKLFSIKAF